MSVRPEYMDLPSNATLPFFAYGLFRPGELAFFRLKPFVQSREGPNSLRGSLRIRDGLLIADRDGNSKIEGDVLHFLPSRVSEAYQQIVDLEPSKQYTWGEVDVQGQRVNLLWGRSPKKGSVILDFPWSSWTDPLFTVALDVIEKTIHENEGWEWDMSNTFRLQMAYLLLWTAAERYASLRYHLKRDVTLKVKRLATESAFTEQLRQEVTDVRSVQRADQPEDKVTLDPSNADSSIDYYYQVRSNMVHQGKGMPNDHDIVLKSCKEFLAIFRDVLSRAQVEARAGA